MANSQNSLRRFGTWPFSSKAPSDAPAEETDVRRLLPFLKIMYKKVIKKWLFAKCSITAKGLLLCLYHWINFLRLNQARYRNQSSATETWAQWAHHHFKTPTLHLLGHTVLHCFSYTAATDWSWQVIFLRVYRGTTVKTEPLPLPGVFTWICSLICAVPAKWRMITYLGQR